MADKVSIRVLLFKVSGDSDSVGSLRAIEDNIIDSTGAKDSPGVIATFSIGTRIYIYLRKLMGGSIEALRLFFKFSSFKANIGPKFRSKFL